MKLRSIAVVHGVHSLRWSPWDAAETTRATADPQRRTRRRPPRAATETLDVSLTDFEIDPANPRIDQPGQVELPGQERRRGTVHNLEVEGPSGEAVIPDNLKPGERER